MDSGSVSATVNRLGDGLQQTSTQPLWGTSYETTFIMLMLNFHVCTWTCTYQCSSCVELLTVVDRRAWRWDRPSWRAPTRWITTLTTAAVTGPSITQTTAPPDGRGELVQPQQSASIGYVVTQARLTASYILYDDTLSSWISPFFRLNTCIFMYMCNVCIMCFA